jgi:hypothetical protein
MQKLAHQVRSINTARNAAALGVLLAIFGAALKSQDQTEIGREVAIPRHLKDGEEFDLAIHQLVTYGRKLFEAHFTSQEGAGPAIQNSLPGASGRSEASRIISITASSPPSVKPSSTISEKRSPRKRRFPLSTPTNRAPSSSS